MNFQELLNSVSVNSRPKPPDWQGEVAIEYFAHNDFDAQGHHRMLNRMAILSAEGFQVFGEKDVQFGWALYWGE